MLTWALTLTLVVSAIRTAFSWKELARWSDGLLSTTVERFAFGEAKEHRERSVRRRQPVHFLGLAQRFFSTATTFP
jgi:hypothetical protein